MPTLCPCGSLQEYAQCCEPFISGQQMAPTPETLMRSRYTAYTQANMDYIIATMKGGPLRGFDASSAREWASKAQWQGLKVLAASPILHDTTQGFVEFIAYYHWQNEPQTLHEKSLFRLAEGRWYYVGQETAQPKIQDALRVGRNEPCPCGSHKKYKKCCAIK